MTEPVTPTLDSDLTVEQSFEAYTAFPPAEQALEQQLGARSKLQLPPRFGDTFVRFLPWMVLVFLPVHFAAVLLLLGVTALATMFGSFSFIGALISTGVFVLDVVALPGLFSRSRRGWAFYLYALALSAVGNVIGLSVIGLIINAALLWIAFQVKYRYS